MADLYAEASVLRCAMLDPGNAVDILAPHGAADFTDPFFRRAFSALCVNATKGKNVGDLTLFGAELSRQGQGFTKEDVARLIEVSPLATQAKFYSGEIIEKRCQRELAGVLSHALESTGNGPSASEIIANTAQALERIGTDATDERFPVYSMAALAAADLKVEYHIPGILVKGQPAMLVARQKDMKTTTAISLGLSISTGRPLFNRFPVEHQAGVLFMSGESGLATLSRNAKKIGQFMELDVGRDCPGLFISDKLPQFDHEADLRKLKRLIRSTGATVLIIDPLYLCFPGKDVANLFVTGEIIRPISELCQELGVTLILLHHAKKPGAAGPFVELGLSDIAFAGFGEFTRGWIFLSRREAYNAAIGVHRMIFSGGGSAGHSFRYALDFDEGPYDPVHERDIGIEVYSMEDVREAQRVGREAAKKTKAAEKLESYKRKILDALAGKPDGETVKEIRKLAGLNGSQTTLDAFADLLRTKHIESVPVVKGGRSFDGYRLIQG